MQPILKGVYIVRLDLSNVHLLGVAKKIRAQVSALSTYMQEVDLYFLNKSEIMKNDKVLKRYGTGSLWRRVTYYFLFYLFLAKEITDIDFAYIRYQRSSPIFLFILSRLKAKCPNLIVLVELPSYPYHTEEVSLRDRLFGFIDRISRPFLHRYVDRIVTFSQETEIFDIQTIRTDNGVDVDSLKISQELTESNTIRFMGVANLSFWHGYDRIIAGLAEYYVSDRTRKIVFDIVGTGQELRRLQNDVQKFKLEAHVRFYGPMHGKDLDELIAQCHIGVSSIGMHRLEVDTSNLKSREFCARGIPFVIAYDDRDFKNNFPYAFHAPANDDPIDIGAVIEFYDQLTDKHSDYRQLMRSYAEKHLTWIAKMEPVIAFIYGSSAERE